MGGRKGGLRVRVRGRWRFSVCVCVTWRRLGAREDVPLHGFDDVEQLARELLVEETIKMRDMGKVGCDIWEKWVRWAKTRWAKTKYTL